MAEALQAGLNVTAIGMGVVFVLLTLLVGVIRGMSAFSQLIEGYLPALPEPSAAIESGTRSQQEIVGVISAAIAAHRRRKQGNQE